MNDFHFDLGSSRLAAAKMPGRPSWAGGVAPAGGGRSARAGAQRSPALWTPSSVDAGARAAASSAKPGTRTTRTKERDSSESGGRATDSTRAYI